MCTTDGVGISHAVCPIDAEARTCATDGVGISHPVCPIDAGARMLPKLERLSLSLLLVLVPFILLI